MPAANQKYPAGTSESRQAGINEQIAELRARIIRQHLAAREVEMPAAEVVRESPAPPPQE